MLRFLESVFKFLLGKLLYGKIVNQTREHRSEIYVNSITIHTTQQEKKCKNQKTKKYGGSCQNYCIRCSKLTLNLKSKNGLTKVSFQIIYKSLKNESNSFKIIINSLKSGSNPPKIAKYSLISGLSKKCLFKNSKRIQKSRTQINYKKLYSFKLIKFILILNINLIIKYINMINILNFIYNNLLCVLRTNDHLRSSFNLLINAEKEAWKRVYSGNFLNILSLNVRGISDETSSSTIAKLEAISNLVDESNSNIILLQETNRNIMGKTKIKKSLLNNFFDEFVIITGDGESGSRGKGVITMIPLKWEKYITKIEHFLGRMLIVYDRIDSFIKELIVLLKN